MEGGLFDLRVLDFLNGLVASVRHQCHKSGNLDGVGDAALVLVRQACASGGLNLEFGGDELAKEGYIFVVYFDEVLSVKNSSFHRLEW